MLTFFRRIIFTPIGGIIALLFIAILGVGFALTDSAGMRGSGAGQDKTVAATVGKETVSATDIANGTNGLLDMYRRQSPQTANLSMAEFIAKGGFEGPLESRLNGMAMAQFADSMGIRVGKSLVDNEIGQIPGMRGLDGKVDAANYAQFLALLKMTDQQMHDQMARDILTKLLLGPISPEATKKMRAATTLATPYASMLLEKRTGTVAFIDTKKMAAGAAPTDPEAQAYYKANMARYIVPERRSARYIMFTIDDLKKRAAPSEDEIAAAYKAQASRFAAGETRTVKQVVLGDQKSADALAAKVRGGAAIDAAAKAAGLEAAAIENTTKADYVTKATAALADPVFAAVNGAVVGPVKVALGWAVVHIDAVTPVAAKSLDQARPDLVKELTDKKTIAVSQDLRDQIDELTSSHKTLDQIAAALKLPIVGAPALTAEGMDPDAKTPVAPDPKLQTLYQLAFQSGQDDDPQLIPMGQDGSFALAQVDKILPAAPRAYAAIADQVKKDIAIDRQVKAAQGIANGILAKVNKGMPLAKAMAEAGVVLDATKPMSANRAQLFTGQRPPAPLLLLFSKPLKSASILEAPYKGGWFIVVVDSIERGDARGKPDVIDRMRTDLGAGMGDELRQQFVRAVRDKIGVKKNDDVLKKLRDELLGKGQPQQ